MADDDKLSPHFLRSELACRCGCGLIPLQPLIDRLERLRGVVGKPLTVTSGARCAKHNAEVGGAAGSFHMQGVAVDIKCLTGDFRYELLRAAIQLGFRGIGIADDFLHLDLRAGMALVWKY